MYQVHLTADQIRAIARLQEEGHWTHVHIYTRLGYVEVEGPFPSRSHYPVERFHVYGDGTFEREAI